MRACFNGDLSAVEAFIKNGADLDEQDKNGRTALMYAAMAKHKPIIDCLALAGANLDIKDVLWHSADYYLKHSKPSPKSDTECERLLMSARLLASKEPDRKPLEPNGYKGIGL